MEENVIGITSAIMINVDVSVKNIIYVKKIIFGILKISSKAKTFITILHYN